MPWMIGGAILGSAIIGGISSSNAAGKAADAQRDAANAANATQLQMYNQTRDDNMPALGARNDALSRLESLLGLKAGGQAIDPTKDPGYQFGLDQGQKALNAKFAAKGMYGSGAALKAAAEYGNDYATTKYDAAFNRILNPLQSVAGLGQTGANSIASAGQNEANQISANQLGIGNAQAAAGIAQSNAWNNAANQFSGWAKNQNWSGGGGGISTNAMYGGGGGGYDDQNGLDMGWHP